MAREPIKKIKLKNGVIRWRFVIDVGVKPDGKRDQRTHTFDTLDEARKERAKIIADLARNVFVRPTKKTLGEHLDEWLKGRRGIKRGTAGAHENSLKPVYERYGHVPLQDLTKAHIDELVTFMLTFGRRRGSKRGTELAPSTVIRTLGVLAAALDDAVRQGLVPRNVARLVDRPSLAQREMSTWTEEEAKTFLDRTADHRLRVAWMLSLCGLRRGEVLGLRWCDIDLVEKTLTITIERTISKGIVYEDKPKSAKSTRTLPLDGDLYLALREFRQRQAAEQLKAGSAYAPKCPDCGEAHIVVDELGNPIHPESFSDRFEALVKRLRLPKIRLHDTRHTCGTLMVLRGVPIPVIAAWLGHAKASFTNDTYLHAQPHALADASKRLHEALRGLPTAV